MSLAAAGNLGQMGNAEDLMMPGNLTELLTDNLCRRTADPAVHFVEDDRTDGAGPGQHLFQRQHDAGKFAAGGNRLKRLALFAHVRAKIKFRLVDAVFGQRRFSPVFRTIVKDHIEPGVFHPQGPDLPLNQSL